MQPSYKAEEPSQVMPPVSPAAGLGTSYQLWVIFWFLVFQVLGYLTAVVCPGAF